MDKTTSDVRRVSPEQVPEGALPFIDGYMLDGTFVFYEGAETPGNGFWDEEDEPAWEAIW